MGLVSIGSLVSLHCVANQLSISIHVARACKQYYVEWIPSSHHAGLWTTNFFLSFPQFERNKNNNMSAGFTIKAMDFGTPYSKPSHERAWYTLFVHAGTGFSHFSKDWSSMGWAGLRQISAVCIILYKAFIWVRPGYEGYPYYIE